MTRGGSSEGGGGPNRMRIGFFVNDIATEQGVYTTTRLAYEAHRRGHAACYVGVEDFAFGPGGSR